MTTPDPLDPLEAELAREPWLADDGFTERVLARLPPRRARARAAALATSWLAAAGVGAATLPGLVADGLRAAAALPAGPAALAVAAAAAALALAAGASALGRSLSE